MSVSYTHLDVYKRQASLLQMTGQFTVYTYIVPFLVGSMALDKPTISLVLLVYGGGGILGALLGGRAADRWPGPATFVAFLLLHALAPVSYTHLERSPLRLEQARAQLRGAGVEARLLEGDLLDLPPLAERFELISMTAVLLSLIHI